MEENWDDEIVNDWEDFGAEEEKERDAKIKRE